MTDEPTIEGSVSVVNRRPSRVVAGIMLGLIVAACITSFFGLPIWVMLGVSMLPCLTILRDRVGGALAGTCVFLIGLAGVLFLMMITRWNSLPLEYVVGGVFALTGSMASVYLWRLDRPWARSSVKPLAVLVPSGAGAGLWLGALFIASFRPQDSAFSWILRGDSANNLMFARLLIRNNGVTVGPTESPVPLPPGLLALAMAGSRHASDAQGAFFSIDFQTFAQVWALLISLTCVLAGIATGILVRSDRPGMRALMSALGSLIPLSWFVSGMPLEYGFFNAHVILPVVLACWIVFVRGESHPALAFSLLCVGGTLLLATWGPLVLVPASLAGIVLVRRFRQLLALSWPMRLGLMVAILQLVLYGIFVTLPTLIEVGSALTFGGGMYSFSRPLVASIALAVLLLATVQRNSWLIWGSWALAGGLGLGLAVLLYSNRNSENLWGYYPLKYLWLTGVILLIVGIGLAGSLIGDLNRSAVLRMIALGTLAGLGYLILIQTQTVVGYDAKNPIQRIAAGDAFGFGDETYNQIVKLASAETPQVLWQSEDPMEGSVDFWLLQALSERQKDKLPLVILAYSIDREKVEDLCSVLKITGPTTVVHTKNTTLRTELESSCPEVGGVVIVSK